MKKVRVILGMVVATLTALAVGAGVATPTQVSAAKDDIVIVIDPGHGGSQNGADYDGVLEKDINIVVASTIVEELEKFDGVEVYMTHDSAEDTMSIQKRAEFADKKKADYFFCIHFNASANHNFYGAETWITSYGRYYSEMYAFSEILLEEFGRMGVFNRGIKTKLGEDQTDYYGILRMCPEFDIPAVIIEHCHMDNAKDKEYFDTEEDLVKFGQMDAQAIAKFLKLKSEKLGVDYSTFEYTLPEAPADKLQNDVTNPVCNTEVTDIDDVAKRVTFKISAADDEQPILYYGYSYDGGATFSDLMIWPQEQDSIEVMIPYEKCMDKQLVVQVFNGFNLEGRSEIINVAENVQAIRDANAPKDSVNASGQSVYHKQSGGEIYLVIAILCAVGAVVTLVMTIVSVQKHGQKRRKN